MPHKKNRVHIEETGDLIIRHVLASDEGKYQCVAHNMAATRESPAISLSVYGKKQTKDGTKFCLFSTIEVRGRKSTAEFTERPPSISSFVICIYIT